MLTRLRYLLARRRHRAQRTARWRRLVVRSLDIGARPAPELDWRDWRKLRRPSRG